MFVFNKVRYFHFLVSCLHTFNPQSLSSKSVGDDLGCKCNNKHKHEERKCCKFTKIRVNGSERRPFIFIFRLIIVLRDSYQADEILMEIEECKQKVSDNSQGIIQEFNLGVGSHVSITLWCNLCSWAVSGGAVSPCCKPPVILLYITSRFAYINDLFCWQLILVLLSLTLN